MAKCDNLELHHPKVYIFKYIYIYEIRQYLILYLFLQFSVSCLPVTSLRKFE